MHALASLTSDEWYTLGLACLSRSRWQQVRDFAARWYPGATRIEVAADSDNGDLSFHNVTAYNAQGSILCEPPHPEDLDESDPDYESDCWDLPLVANDSTYFLALMPEVVFPELTDDPAYR